MDSKVYFEDGEADVELIWAFRQSCMKQMKTLDGIKSNHPLYGVWSAMLNRCYNSNSQGFPNYGARGISVCERWMNFRSFILDMYPCYSPELSLDRKNGDGDYDPENCRWATDKQQSDTKREGEKRKSRFRHQLVMEGKKVPVRPTTIYPGYFGTRYK